MAFDEEAYRAGQEREWSEAAAAWNKWWPAIEEGNLPINMAMLDWAGIQEGSRVLDVATGIGEPALTAARRVGSTGLVVATDQSQAMLDIARQRAKDANLTNVEFRKVPGETLAFEAEPFDAVLCRFGLMFCTDLLAATRAVHRHLREGGTYVSVLWALPYRVPAVGLPLWVIGMNAEIKMPPRGTPGMYALARPAPALQALAEAGFRDVRVEKVRFTATYESAQIYAQQVQEMAVPLVALLRHLGPGEIKAIWGEVTETVERLFGQPDGRIVIRNETDAIVARK